MITVLPTGKNKKIKILLASFTAVVLAVAFFVSHYFSARRSREGVLRQELYAIRSAIDQYTLDKQKAPRSLRDLVSANYLREIPVDPMTHSSDSWETVQEDSPMAIDRQQPGIVDIHSGSHQTSKDGTAYNTW